MFCAPVPLSDADLQFDTIEAKAASLYLLGAGNGYCFVSMTTKVFYV